MFDIYCLKEKKGSYSEILTKIGLITETIHSGDFDFVNKERLSYNNCTARFNNRKLVVVPSGNDPYLYGVQHF